MIKILIIDDEPLVRLGMKSIIEWNKYGYIIVGEAGNGAQGLERIGELSPDVVLIDIMMPQMDGIEVIQKARERGFKGKFIILSCVSEFEYLQKAVKFGISNYILKNSVNPQTILETVNEATKDINKKRILSDVISENYAEDENFVLNEFLNLIFKNVIHDTEDIKKKLGAFRFTGDSLYLQIYSCRDSERKEILYKLAGLGKSILDEGYWGTSYVNFEDYLVMLLDCPSLKIAEEVAFRMQETSRQYFNLELAAGIRKVEVSCRDIKEKYRMIKAELSRDFFRDDQPHVLEDLISPAEYASYDKLSTTLEIIRDMILKSGIMTEKEAKKIYASTIEYVMAMFELDDSDIIGQTGSQQTIASALEKNRSFGEMHSVSLGILKKCYETAERKGYPGYDDELIIKMIQYIYDHINSKISAKDVADHVHFSLDYTCRYFKKRTQTNLTDYILRLKVYRSRKELMDGMSIADVAERYSFSSDGHYVKVFKKYEGITPGAFVRKNKNNSKIST